MAIKVAPSELEFLGRFFESVRAPSCKMVTIIAPIKTENNGSFRTATLAVEIPGRQQVVNEKSGARSPTFRVPSRMPDFSRSWVARMDDFHGFL